MDAVLPRLTKMLSLWELLLAKLDCKGSACSCFPDIYHEFESLHAQVRQTAQDYIISPQGGAMPVEVRNIEVARSLGILDEVNKMKVLPGASPVSSGNNKNVRYMGNSKMLPPSKRFKMENSIADHQNGTEVPKSAAAPVASATQAASLVKSCSVSVSPLEISGGAKVLSASAEPTSSSSTNASPDPTPSLAAPPAGPTQEQKEGPSAQDQDVHMADATVQDANTADATVQDANTADATVQDANTADATVQDANTAEATVQDINMAETTVQDLNMAEATVQDINMAETTVQDLNMAEATVHQVNGAKATIQMTQPDSALSSSATSTTDRKRAESSPNPGPTPSPAQPATSAQPQPCDSSSQPKELQAGQEIYIQTEGLTVQLAEPGSDGIVIVNGPDGTTMHIQTPEGVPLEAVQALLGIEASDGDRLAQQTQD
ncbi:probable endo-1,3(4)-beta-glucanase AO090023000083 isoform X2 [Poecilia formosa]|uniref:probable endo-1,3(4)-beta-glucanase AO090023000083 isoform X2 n=1 Tax=Poecilia formosa TaxID=48698 RepID=UPI0007B8E597|nr:PREDICTED: probable endo-1,3(4)-beta-glucanase AO090023000083 isoform X2 [Poecilia formosa]